MRELEKNSPVPVRKEMSMTEYAKLVDTNANLVDKIKEQQETIKGMQENQDSAIKIMKMYEDLKKDYIRVKANEKILADLLDKEQKKNKKAIEYIKKEEWYLEESIDIIKGDSMIPIYSGNVRRRYLQPVLDILKGGGL